jgi:hypothetical protein
MRRLDVEEDEEDPGDAMFRRPRRQLPGVTGATATITTTTSSSSTTTPQPPPQLALEIE